MFYFCLQGSVSDLRHLEVCPEAAVICNKIIDRLDTSRSGCFLICDYGFDDPEFEDRDTLRAFQEHKQCHPLHDPGNADLTADVDFSYLRSLMMEKSIVYGPASQRDFLIQVGIGLRLKVCVQHVVRCLNDE